MLLPRRKSFDIDFRFTLEGDSRIGGKEIFAHVSAIEVIVHHTQDGYTRMVKMPFEGFGHTYETFVQYGTGIMFDEIEVSLLDHRGRRSEPQFFTVPRQPVIYLDYRKAQAEAS